MSGIETLGSEPQLDLYAKLYRSLYRIRRMEEEIVRLYPTDKIKSPVHLSIGQEAVCVGVCEALRLDDVVFGTYRSHALYLAKGGDIRQMAAELAGKATGCCKGKGGSMHLCDVAAGIMGTSAVVATTIPQAVGYAYAVKLRRSDTIVVSFFGDGAVEEGVWHESMNYAKLKQLPILFVCENNLYAIHARFADRQPADNICDRVRAYGIPAERIEGNDIIRMHDSTRRVAAEIRNGAAGPYFLECMTYRWKEHVGPGEDWDFGYRSRAEAEPWIGHDQLRRIGQHLDPAVRSQIEEASEVEVRDAFDFAESSPFPDLAELYTDVIKGS